MKICSTTNGQCWCGTGAPAVSARLERRADRLTNGSRVARHRLRRSRNEH
jgi:hypothetical protein